MVRKGDYYNRTNTCDKCREKGIDTKLVPGNVLREYDKNGNWTGRWLCRNCYNYNNSLDTDIYRNLEKQKIIQCQKSCCECGNSITYVSPDGKEEWIKCFCNKENCTKYICKKCYNKRYCEHSSWKNGELSSDSNTGRGFIGQQIVAKRYNVEDCNLKMKNFGFYVDLDKILGYGYGEVKTATLKMPDGRWPFSGINSMNFDTLFLVCMDNSWPWKDVERVYAIPSWELINKSHVTITKNSKRNSWYKEYMIDRDSFNEIYHGMKLENCTVLRRN